MNNSPISFNIIVKNEEKCIANCLNSIREIAGEIIIIDTGCSDSTIDICKKFTDKIYFFKWEDNFAAARNYAKSKSSLNWIFLIDADEKLCPDSYPVILQSVKSPEINGFICSTKNFTNNSSTSNWRTNSNDEEKKMADGAAGWFPSDKVRLFKNLPEYYFSGHIHELIDNSILLNKGVLKDADFFIYHYGYIFAELDNRIKIKKLEFYEKLNEKKFAEYNDLKSCYELAKQKRSMKKYDEALNLFNRCISENYRLSEVYNEISVINMELKDYKKSSEFAQLSLNHDSTNISALNNLALSLWQTGNTEESIKIFKKIISLKPEHSNAYYNLAAIYKTNSDNYSAKEMYKMALKYNPNDIKTLENYGKIILYDKNYEELKKILERILKIESTNQFALANKDFVDKQLILIDNKQDKKYFMEGIEFFNKNDFKQALKCFRKSLNIIPNSSECRKYAAQCYLKLGDLKKYQSEIDKI
ncbi:glycosyltransferase [Candidatus Dependentiae bacterium]|nr:glycosyltransferase [Candidatus Dependentiae bacterium]